MQALASSAPALCRALAPPLAPLLPQALPALAAGFLRLSPQLHRALATRARKGEAGMSEEERVSPG